MKALMINSLSNGGAERVVVNIYKTLKNQRDDILLICLIDYSVYNLPEDSSVLYLTRFKSFKSGYNINKLFAYPLMIFRLLRIIKKHNVDLIQSHLYSASIINVIAKVLGGKHKVQIVNHSHISTKKYSGIGQSIKFLSLKSAYNKADLLISISQKMKADIDKFILKGKTQHIVIANPHNTIDIISKSQEPVNFIFNNDKKYLVTVSRLIPGKKIDNIIRVLKDINTGYNVDLLILGEGEEMENLKTLSRHLEITDKVHFVGYDPNPYKYIFNCDIFVLASESEGLPNVLFESLLCKTRIVSTDCHSGPREILAPGSDINIELVNCIEKGEHGILCAVNNETSLKEAIVTSLNMDKEEIIKCKENGFNYALSFSTEKIAKLYEEVIFKN